MAETELTKLKPCKCGGRGVTVDGEPTKHELKMLKEYGLTPMRRFKVVCNKCGKETQSYTCKELAFVAWNRRLTMAEKEYIKRETALSFVLNAAGDWAASYSELQKYPTADVAPVKRGEWQRDKEGIYQCSECKRLAIPSGYGQNLSKYCPNCGARMEGEQHGT